MIFFGNRVNPTRNYLEPTAPLKVEGEIGEATPAELFRLTVVFTSTLLANLTDGALRNDAVRSDATEPHLTRCGCGGCLTEKPTREVTEPCRMQREN